MSPRASSASRPPVVRPRPHAFTLVELLVVIGIIALLIAILMPALNRARVAAREVQCLSQLRQIGNAVAMYVSESRGWLPWGSFDGDPANSDPTGATAPAYPNKYSLPVLWRWQIGPYLGISELPRLGVNPFDGYTGLNSGVFRCPDWQMDIMFEPSVHHQYATGGYGWNTTYMGTIYRRFNTGQKKWVEPNISQRPVKLNQVRRTSERILAGDTADDVDAPSTTAQAGKGLSAFCQLYPPSEVIPLGQAGQETRQISRRHRNGANMLWADFHAEWKSRDELYRGRSAVGPDDYYYVRSD